MTEQKSKKIKDLTGTGSKSFGTGRNRVTPRNDFIPFQKEEIEQSVPTRFKTIVEKYPDHIAVKTGPCSITYKALDQQANSVAQGILNAYNDTYALNENEKKRYSRQIKLHGWGIEAQEKLKSTTVFVAGAGGSGSPLIQQLALCGVGTIIICDYDTVELSNLNRQVLHDESRIGTNKALSAQMTVKHINPHVNVIAYNEKISADNVDRLVGDAAVIFDNVDDIETKFILSQCALNNHVPHILSSMIDMDAYAVVLYPPHGPCFHCLYDRNIINEIAEIKKISIGGDKSYEKFSNPVASPALFLAAGFAVNEALKIILNLGLPSYNKFFLFDQRGVKNICESFGYRQIVYPFSRHFKELSKNQGFDWDKGPLEEQGNVIKELVLEPDPQCPLCRKIGQKQRQLKNIAAVNAALIVADAGLDEKPQRAAALLFEHGLDMIPGILGTLKTGILYVPLDVSYPVDRLSYILEDSDARVIVTNSENIPLAKTLRNNINKNIAIVDINKIPGNISQDGLNISIDPGALAYILYTSGSTGKPKGVMQNHRNVLHHCRVYTNALHIHAQDRLTLFSSYSFDAAKMDIYGALLNGAALYPYNIKQENNLWQLPSWLIAESITIYHSIPTVYRYFISLLEGKEIAAFPRLRMIVLGGEAVYKQDVINYQEYFSDDCLFVNGLGPTESTLALQYFIDKQTEIAREAVPVGYPVEETEVSLLTGQNQEAGVLGVGEIVFKSEHLALGYWKNPELTAEKFRPLITLMPQISQMKNKNSALRANFQHSALIIQHSKYYQTGDLGRRLPDGAIEFVGRSDFQLKISGYRIEAGEIESKLDQVPGIKKSVIVSKTGNNGENFLAAYYVPSGEKDINEKDLVSFLRETLPDYMIPSVFFSLNGFPLTATGKIDRKTLAQQDISHLLSRGEPETPANETEILLLRLWKEVLKRDTIGVNENFFVLGGNSIKAILLVSLLHRELEVKASLVDIFKNPTIKDLAKYVKKSQKSIYEAITPVEKKEYHLQSSAQGRLYFLAQFKETGTVYNMPSVRKLVEKPDMRKFETIFKHIIARHETLRTSFEIIGHDPVQRIHDKVDFMIEIYKADLGKTAADILHRFVRPFDLAKAPLLRVGVATLPGEQYYLLYDLHHIICDGTSITLLYDEFTRLYEGAECTGLPVLQIQYKDFSDWQNRLLESDRIKIQEQYWLGLYADAADITRLNLPLDYPRPSSLSYEGDSFQFETGPVETAALRAIGNTTGATLYMSLLAVLNTLFYKYTGQEDIIIGVGVAGRSHGGLENIIGMFVNMLAVRNQPHGSKTWEEFLSEVKGNSLKAFENQDVQFEALIEKLELERDPAYSPLLDVMLVVQNFTSPVNPVEIARTDYLSIPVRSRHKTAKFDIGLLVRETDRGIDFELEYRTTLFKQETIARLAGHFLTVLKQVSENPFIPIGTIEIISMEEKRQLLDEFNRSPFLEESFKSTQTIHGLFEERIRQSPDHRAVVDGLGNRVITYRHLNGKANKIGRLLREKGIGCDSIVAVMIDRSIALLEGILGILKAGGAYLPLDPTIPFERINAMIKDSGTNLLISDNALSPGFNPGIEILNIQTESLFCRVEREVENNSSGHDLLYVVYTSGSTGKPKGIMLEHRNLLNLIRFQHHYTNIDFNSVLQFASIGFDVSFQEIFSTLLWKGGGTLYLIPNEIRTDSTRLFRYLEKTKITTLFLPTSFFKFLFNGGQEGVIFPGGVKHIAVAG
ncbi:MAG: AMP-binding protein, partial [Acidobacteria bacterium]|nr:AMP-binding protein [Acidobacteriota bacterium]